MVHAEQRALAPLLPLLRRHRSHVLSRLEQTRRAAGTIMPIRLRDRAQRSGQRGPAVERFPFALAYGSRPEPLSG